jgi:hypothetical protein
MIFWRDGGDEFAILVSDLTLDQASARFAGLLELPGQQ